MTLIKVNNVFKIFGKTPKKAQAMLKEGRSKDEIMAKTGHTVGINNVSFEVEAGETFVVMGLSGSGKSTLIRCLNQLIEPSAGSILINDEDITQMSKQKLMELRRNKMSMVFQSFAIFPHRTVIQNAAYGLKVMGKPLEERNQRAQEVLELVGLKAWEDQMPAQLSGGMQQRVGLARALATDPDILLMDEAFSALDPLIRKEMQSELLTLQDKMKKTIIFITHDLDEALKIGDRIALMKEGEIVQIGTPEEIMMSPATHYVEKFVEDVDRSRILTAEMIMRKQVGVVNHPKDGPRVALRRMQDNDISSIFVVDKQYRLIGLVTAEDALTAVENQETSLDSMINRDIPTTLPHTPLREMFAMLTGKNVPLAVIDDENRFQGVSVYKLVIEQ
jgi:glycine betaine/proline transport system ATP-binding protein